MSDTFDCIVIGSGPGGYVAAVRAAQLGMSVAVVERDSVVGGRCLNYACIPAKAVLRSADILSEVREAGEFGIVLNGTEPTVDFGAIGERRSKVISTLTGGVSGLFKKNNVELISGEASLTAEGDVRVGDTVYTATKAVILATGSVKRPVPGLSFGGNVIGTEEAWALEE
ncbi:MAG: dihydrolipoamide dehydrogenase, partial [Baekduia sp.]|nr:dihydrolipoamide dehydrogenase [Baekduia sp.]